MDRKQKYQITRAVISGALVVALLFLRPLPIALVYSIVAFAVTSVALSNLFFQHDLIRDRYTLPGIAFGILASAFVPSLQGQDIWWRASIESFNWAVGTLVILAGFGELLRRYHGPRVVQFDPPNEFTWTRFNDTASLEIGGELFSWASFFSRDADEITIECQSVNIDSTPMGAIELAFRSDHLFIGERRYLLTGISEIRGLATNLTVPSETLGFGVIKAMAAFTAIFGWQGSIFILLASCIVGTLTIPLIRRSVTTNKVSFMPFLSASALLWMFCGPELLAIYFASVHRK